MFAKLPRSLAEVSFEYITEVLLVLETKVLGMIS